MGGKFTPFHYATSHTIHQTLHRRAFPDLFAPNTAPDGVLRIPEQLESSKCRHSSEAVAWMNPGMLEAGDNPGSSLLRPQQARMQRNPGHGPAMRCASCGLRTQSPVIPAEGGAGTSRSMERARKAGTPCRALRVLESSPIYPLITNSGTTRILKAPSFQRRLESSTLYCQITIGLGPSLVCRKIGL